MTSNDLQLSSFFESQCTMFIYWLGSMYEYTSVHLVPEAAIKKDDDTKLPNANNIENESVTYKGKNNAKSKAAHKLK